MWKRSGWTRVFVPASVCAIVFWLAAVVQAEGPFSKLVVLGDSLSDTGNFHALSGGVVAGEPYFEGRFSNGPVWVERLAESLGLPAPQPFLLGGTNYAFGTAQTGDGLSPALVPNVGTQIDLLLTVDGPLSGDELIVVLAGGNDALTLSKSPWAAARNVANHVAELAGAGGEVFVVPTLFGPGRTPLLRGTLQAPAANLWAAIYNDALDARLARLEDELGIVILRVDLAGLTGAVFEAPDAFGFTNVIDPACPRCGVGVPLLGAKNNIAPEPDRYVWWDFVHPTRVLHGLWGELAVMEVEMLVLD
jgi:phospholipase/lecithinase/hemolysin